MAVLRSAYLSEPPEAAMSLLDVKFADGWPSLRGRQAVCLPARRRRVTRPLGTPTAPPSLYAPVLPAAGRSPVPWVTLILRGWTLGEAGIVTWSTPSA
jgi:hypothetical protein